MNRKPFWMTNASFAMSAASMLLLAVTVMCACKPVYRVTEISGTFVQMDTSYDLPPHEKMQGFVNSYKTALSKEMNIVIGKSTIQDYKRPESLLTKFTSDVMKAYGDEPLPQRADTVPLPEGNVTVGNPRNLLFDNAITFPEVKAAT